jgi:hypothetical protein
MTGQRYDQLIDRLDRFIRKYYLNRMIKGGLLWLGLVLVLFLCFSLLESQFWFDTSVRKALFYSFLGIGGGSLIYWVGIPAIKYYRLGETISREQAAAIIGTHFKEVEDKLLNILQLQAQANTTEENSLILAGIDQKSAELKSVPFLSAIDLSKNRKYLRYALPPLLIVLGLLLIAPTLITDSSKRILKNNVAFEKPAPFEFQVQNDNLEVVQFDDYTLTVKTEGELSPNEAYVDIGGYTYRMKKQKPGQFAYTFKQVKEDTPFRLYSGNTSSKPYSLSVIEKPQLAGFTIDLDYPAYTGLKDKSIQNTGDLTVPEGTDVHWFFQSKGVNAMELKFDNDSWEKASRTGEEQFDFSSTIVEDQSYSIYISSSSLHHADSASYQINTIKDKYPVINANAFVDSLDTRTVYFAGECADDYGLTNLYFHYKIKDKGSSKETHTERLALDGNPYTFEYAFDLDSAQLEAGQSLIYYFEVYDNDGVNGRKSSRSNIMSYRKPSLEEVEERAKEQQEDIEQKLEESIEKRESLQKKLENLRNKLLNKRNMEWQDRKELEKIMEQHREMQEKIDKAKKKFQQKKKEEEAYKEQSEEEKEKQEKLEEMFKQLEEDEEMKELMDKIKKLMQELNKDQALDMMEKMQKQEKQMQLNTERLKNMLKQLEFEKRLQDQLKKIDDLAKKQEEVRKETQEKEQPTDSLAKKQEELNKEFDEVKEEMDELEKKNKSLPNPKPMDQMSEQMENIQREMNEAQENLQKGKSGDAERNQKNAEQKMQEMQQMMKSGMQASSMQQMQEDMETLRQILENLVTISFDQEDLIRYIRITDPLTPKFAEHTQKQFKLEEDFQIVEDSLIALSKRNLQIESYILEKVDEVNTNFEKSLAQLEERVKDEANRYQQGAMKNLNDLALMLSEAMKNMQQQMSNMMPGTQMCNKPKPSMNPGQSDSQMPLNKVTKGQKKLNEQMKKMAEENQKKSKKGGGDSEEFAKMAQEQAKLRKMLRDFQEDKRELGQGDAQLQQIIDKMNQIETDLVNKRLTNEMLNRQEDILTRLLESERAERQRKQKEERKAEQAREIARKQRPPALDEYLKEREAAIEQLRKVSPSLKPYYREMVESYYQRLGNGK